MKRNNKFSRRQREAAHQALDVLLNTIEAEQKLGILDVHVSNTTVDEKDEDTMHINEYQLELMELANGEVIVEEVQQKYLRVHDTNAYDKQYWIRDDIEIPKQLQDPEEQ